MDEYFTHVDAAKFLLFAGSNTDRWNQILGQKITHFKYGNGTVRHVECKTDCGHYIKIQFYSPTDEGVEKTFSSESFFATIFSELMLPEKLSKEIESDLLRKFDDEDFGMQTVVQRFFFELKKNNFEFANELYRLIEFKLSNKLKINFKERANHQLSDRIEKIKNLLNKDAFEEADALYQAINYIVAGTEIDNIIKTYQKPNLDNPSIKKIRTELKKYNFNRADELFIESDQIPAAKYEELKSKHIKEFIEKLLGIKINIEKAIALSKSSQNLLLKARAGSGKTAFLGCKAAFLIDRQNIDPDHILILSFNKKAAIEIGNRIRKDFKYTNFNNARTFHSLAYQLVQPKGDLLFDSNEELSISALFTFVQKIVRKIWNPAFQELMYNFFKMELKELENTGALLNDDEYILFRRNLRLISLDGESVKSFGEKLIADFLFEHNISYKYEELRYWNNRNYRPDFVIYHQQNDYILEHWGVDELDPQSKPPNWWSVDRETYVARIKDKRELWKKKGIPLIETSVRDLIKGSISFKSILKSKLESAGIACQKLPEKELQKKVIRYHRDRITRLFIQFIQRAKKELLSVQEVSKLVMKFDRSDKRTSVFLDLSSRVYSEYEKELRTSENLDFDDLLMEAIRIVNTTNGNCQIKVGQREIRLNELKWIMIDEFQDFTKLFYELISAIRAHNPSIRLVCVGDDWQAINAFAGSNLRYFHCWHDYLPDSKAAYLLTNFRSHEEIITTSNALMTDFGKPSVSLPDKTGGEVFCESIDEVRIELRGDPQYSEEKAKDDQFVFYSISKSGSRFVNDNGYITAKYLKRCYEIITHPDNIGKSIAILSRTNRLYRTSLNAFLSKLRHCLKPKGLDANDDFSNKIRIDTVHGFKGLEADIVIIVNACNGAFPLIHPDHFLFSIFGQSEKDILDEERRLFYVALTRAKKKLWILTEKGRESNFLTTIKGCISSQSVDDIPF